MLEAPRGFAKDCSDRWCVMTATSVDGVPVCGEVAEACVCDEVAEHTVPHTCKCGGQWRGHLDGDDFEVIAWPQEAQS